MLGGSNELTWKRFLSEHPKLRELAIKAGVEDNPQRAYELNSAYFLNCGEGIIKSEAEREFAIYMYCREYENE